MNSYKQNLSCRGFRQVVAAMLAGNNAKRLVRLGSGFVEDQHLLTINVQCDQAQPSCARCTRLGLDCTGAGVRRFIFVDKSSGRGTPKQDAKRSKLIHHASSNYPSPIIRPVSPNSHDSLLSLLVSKLATKDLRYDIAWAYGSFMADIPKRLGHSIALDSATRALTLSLPPSPQARKQPSMDALQNYTAALEATRLALADPVQSKSINTVCAVYFLLLCQV